MKTLFKLPLIIIMICFLMGARGCDESYELERDNVEKQDYNYNKNQPPPYFDWGLERYLLTELYKARNNSLATYSYVRNQYNGSIMSWCPSIGFPIPANTQLTNPQKRIGETALSQAEPNGLYTSPSTRGTYVMCIDKDGMVIPRYYEQDVEAYLTPMVLKDGMLVEAENVQPSLRIANPKVIHKRK